MNRLVQRWHSESDTALCAAQLAALPILHDAFITLHGPLGAGKTTLARHLLQALGVSGPIKSPSYAVVESYHVQKLCIWHFDFYRFSDPREWEDAGFRDIFAAPGLKIAEWPENATGLIPVADLSIHIDLRDDCTRDVMLQAHTLQGSGALDQLADAALACPICYE